MSTSHSRTHVDFDALPVITNPRHALRTQAVALGLIHLEPGRGYSFTHRHEVQEEVYVVVRGRGTILIDGELVPLEAGDLVRVAPDASRALCAADDEPLFVICAGGVPSGFPRLENARYQIDDGIPDYDDPPPWARDDPEALALNARLKERMEEARRRRGEA